MARVFAWKLEENPRVFISLGCSESPGRRRAREGNGGGERNVRLKLDETILKHQKVKMQTEPKKDRSLVPWNRREGTKEKQPSRQLSASSSVLPPPFEGRETGGNHRRDRPWHGGTETNPFCSVFYYYY